MANRNSARFMTRKITLNNGNKLQVIPPKNAYDAVVSSAADVVVYEQSGSYTENGITYGEGVVERNIAIPITEDFWISGTTSQVVYITYTCGG